MGAPCLGVLSLVRDTLEFNYSTKLFHQTVHASSARSCTTGCYTNVICCSLKILPSKLSPGVWYPWVTLGGILGGVSKPAPYG